MFNKINIEYDGPALDPKASKIIVTLAVIGLLYALILIPLNYDAHSEGLRIYVEDKTDISGVINPVTAVLLNFRAYDTLLEIAVLLIVVIAVLPARNNDAPLVEQSEHQDADFVLLALQRWIAPTLILFAGYFLWAGAFKPGGAFQAGALLAGACVLLFQAGLYRTNYTSFLARCLLAAGLIVFVAISTVLIFLGGSLLTYLPDSAHVFILLIEGTATVSIAIALVSLYSSLIDTSHSDISGSQGAV